MMLRAIKELNAPTVFVVVDRIELDTQIGGTFNAADVPNTVPLATGADLEKALKADTRKILITTIFKFGELPPTCSNPRDNIIVLVDEAHRTQEGDLGEKMRAALPNAFFFGLTMLSYLVALLCAELALVGNGISDATKMGSDPVS